MAELDLLTEIHTDMKYVKERLIQHIKDDDEIKKNVIYPLWEKHQQDKGAFGIKKILWTGSMSALAVVAGWLGGTHHGN